MLTLYMNKKYGFEVVVNRGTTSTCFPLHSDTGAGKDLDFDERGIIIGGPGYFLQYGDVMH
jgi:hypothetical protein